MYRTAASFVSSRAGIEPKDLLTIAELQQNDLITSTLTSSGVASRVGGLVVVGSHVPKSTTQLKSLLALCDIVPVELPVRNIIETVRTSESGSHVSSANTILDDMISSIAKSIDRLLLQGKDVVLYTSREFVEGTTLDEASVVSNTLTNIVSTIQTPPSYLVAKGGITSHDVAFRSARISTAKVIGQIELGVPVWRCYDEDCRFPRMNYIVFPGNVGDESALARVVMKLGAKKKDNSSSNSNIVETNTDIVNGTNMKSVYVPSSKDFKILSGLFEAQKKGYAIPAFNICES